MAFDTEKAKQAGYSDEEINTYLSTRREGTEKPRPLGGAIPYLTGGLTGILATLVGSPLLGVPAGGGGYLAGKGIEDILSGQAPGTSLKKPDIGPLVAAAGNIPIGQLARGIPFIGPLLKGAASKPGAAKLTQKAAETATKAGVKIPYEELTGSIRGEVGKRLGEFGGAPQALNRLLAQMAPAELGKITRNPSQLLTLRRQLLESYGKTLLQKLFNAPTAKEKVANIARGQVTKQLHRVAPETLRPDQLYSLYSKIGDVPSLAKKAAVGAIGIPFIRNLLRGAIQE